MSSGDYFDGRSWHSYECDDERRYEDYDYPGIVVPVDGVFEAAELMRETREEAKLDVR